MIKFILYEGCWASGAPKGTEVIARHNIDITYQVIRSAGPGAYDNPVSAEGPIVKLTPDQLAALMSDPEIDILITRSYIKGSYIEGWKLLAFDRAGAKFGQR